MTGVGDEPTLKSQGDGEGVHGPDTKEGAAGGGQQQSDPTDH
ncbi:hypothetical protein [Actinopolymorpha pittospori]|uniref:Uncharacterized protein n=1 Tax=Actinopolymorpha pittospori TaxID=648752 RepID=A0A927MMD8_9ACTN|nr:hypothetical protein [Actinopolymorpha pittospori]MBE1603335.1 hypothetical protein [Actinopolymorpha pittospori]